MFGFSAAIGYVGLDMDRVEGLDKKYLSAVKTHEIKQLEKNVYERLPA